MKALVIRISKAKVSVGDNIVSSIGKGLVLFIGLAREDANSDLVSIAEKIVNLRIFEDESGKLNHSVKDKRFSVLCIPNFTLCADTKRGRRPSFEQAMEPGQANKLFEDFIMLLESKGVEVKKGSFGKHMDIELTSDGPVNIILNSKE